MSPSIAIASRNLLRSPKRSLSLMALLCAAFLTVTLIRAGYAEMFDQVRKSRYETNGHFSFSPKSGTELSWETYLAIKEEAASSGRFTGLSASVDLDGLVGTELRSAPVSGEAVEGFFPDWEADGAVKAELGGALAQSLALKVGDEFSAFIGGIGLTLRLENIVETEVTTRDRFFVRLPLEAFAAAGEVRRVNRVRVWTAGADSDRSALIREAQAWPGVADCEWRAAELGNTEINSIIRVYEDNFRVIFVVVGFVTLLALANVMLLSTWERGVELGTMLSLGTPVSHLVRTLVLESVFLALAACVVGSVLSLAACAVVNLAGGVTFPPPPTISSPVHLTLKSEPAAFFLAAGLSLSCAAAAGLIASAGLRKAALIDLLFERN